VSWLAPYWNSAIDLMIVCDTPHASGTPTASHASAREIGDDFPVSFMSVSMRWEWPQAAATGRTARADAVSSERTSEFAMNPTTSSPAMMYIVVLYAAALATPCPI
jgi:hypothetical protein